MDFSIKDFRIGQRVELHPATDWWMRGARFGKVIAVGRKLVHVKLDLTPRTVINLAPRNIGAIVEGTP